ncbi:hypothetical protein [Hymenobacter algoricola]|uniref:Uncharacterized protein n=1 Tax=Hymenobacter algoricola TaxID=486267 RepID=A0ABP7MHK7_9BACT
MKQPRNNGKTSTLHELVRQLGARTTIVQDTLEKLTQQGHSFTRSTLHSVIRRGYGTPVIVNALLETIEQEKAAQRIIQQRIAQLTEQ